MSRLKKYAPALAFVLGSLVNGPALAAQQREPVRITEHGIVLDFQGADLRLVIAALAEAGGLNIVYSGLPSRSVTLRTNQPVRPSEIRELLESVVAANGFKIVEDGQTLRITEAEPASKAKLTDAPRDVLQSDLHLFVYRLKHARAGKLAGTLRALFGGGAAGAVSTGLSREPLSQQLGNYEIRDRATGNEYGGAADKPLTSRQLPGAVQGEVEIVPHALTNSLLIRASEADWPVIREAIQSLDLRPLQVLIEVLIAEVRRTSTSDLGISVDVPVQTDTETGARLGGEFIGRSAGDFMLQALELGSISADVVLSALSAEGDVTILSRPAILAKNNQEARIMIGSERPFIQVFRALPTDDAIRDQVVQYRDVGTSLTILPTINYDGYVSLEILQEVSTATNEIQFGAPVISTRETSTHLLVKDGHTIVIGGLMDHQRDETESGIPVLNDIPLLGALFGSSEEITIETELFLFLTPHIIETDADAERFRREIEDGTEYLRERIPELPPLIPPDTLIPVDSLARPPSSSPPDSAGGLIEHQR